MNDFISKNLHITKLPITSITPFTLQDFPDRTACIIWFSGCNFACKYCHNPELVKGSLNRLPFTTIDTFLRKRIGLLDGVVLCGGECTLSKEFYDFVQYLNELGYLVKVDTNGTNPDILIKLLKDKLIHYVALDYKAPRNKFSNITGDSDKSFENFLQSLELLCKSEIDLEVRTTVHTSLLNEEDVNSIIDHLTKLKFKGVYAVQNFLEGKTLGNLKDQESELDLKKIKTSKNFMVMYRGF